MFDGSTDRRGPGRGLVWMCCSMMAVLGLSVVLVGDAGAFTQSHRVQFTLTVEAGGEEWSDEDSDADMRARTRRNIAEEVVERIEQRLEAMDIKDYEVNVENGRDIDVTVYGEHSPQTIRGAVIPPGNLEIRPVLVDSSPWLSVAQQLPDNVQLHYEPGAFQSDSFFLVSSSARTLYEAIDLLDSRGDDIEVYPHDDGWRTLNLGDPLATQEDVQSVQLHRNPSGVPFVATTLNAHAAQQVRAGASDLRASQLAVVLDGEVVALEYFSDRSFSETMEIDPPDHLRSRQGRTNWSLQIAGRLGASIPVPLAELED